MSTAIQKALAKAQAIIDRANASANSRKTSPEELAARRAKKAEREEVKRIMAEAYAERNRILGIVPNPDLDDYLASAEAKAAIALWRARRPGEGSQGAVFWDAAFQLAVQNGIDDPKNFKNAGWNKRIVQLLRESIEIEEKQAQVFAVVIKKALVAIANGHMTTDGQLTAAGEGVVATHKATVRDLKDNFDPDAEDEADDEDEAEAGEDF